MTDEVNQQSQEEQVSSDNLFSTESAAQHEAKESEQPAWWLAEGIPGTGDKPDWYIDSKYKTVEDQAKAQNELRKKLGAFTGAPEGDYEVKIQDEYADKFDLSMDSELFKSFSEYAKANNINNDSFNELINLYAMNSYNIAKQIQDEQREYINQERQKLGENAKEIIEQTQNWVESELPTELKQAAYQLGQSAAGIQLLQHFAKKGNFSPVPTANDTINDIKTDQELQDMMRPENGYGRDAEYTRKVNKAWEQRYG